MASPWRIVLVGPMHPFRGGIAHFLEAMYWGLQARGHTVSAVTFTRQYPNLLFPGKTQFETGPLERPVPAVRLISSINPATWFKAARHIARWEPDVLIFKYWMPFFGPAFGTIARRMSRKGAKTLVVVDNAIPHERRPGDIMLGRYFMRAVHGCVVMSDAVARDLDKLGVKAPRRMVAHPLYDVFGKAMDRRTARAELGLQPDAPVLLFFGFIRKYKGLHVLLESMPRIIEAVPDVRLLVAGEFYEDETPYRNIIRRHGLRHHVQLHSGYIPNKDVARYFAAADVVVQPYVTATQSGVAQIAYHFDKPLIVTDVGGLSEIVPHDDAGLVAPPEDPVALAEAVARFFGDNMAARLQEGVRRKKHEFSWDRLYEAIEALGKGNS